MSLAAPVHAQLSAPGNLTASVDSCWGIALSWDSQPAADSFAVFTADTVRYSLTNSFRDSIAVVGVNTTYWVAAINNPGVGDSATAIGFRPAPFATVPGFTASLDRCDGILLSWTDVAGEAGYVLYRDSVEVDTLPPNTVSFLDGTAASGDSVSYRIEAWSDCEPAPVASGTVNGWRKPAAPPVVSGLAATSDLCTGIEVSWIDVPREEAYVIERDGVPIDTIGPDLTVYLDASAFSDITYNYRVGPYNECSASPAFGLSITGRRLQPAPAAPSNVTASDTSCAVVFLSWSLSVTDGTYIIYRDNIAIDTVPSATLTYVDSVPGGSYVYGVAGENACGTSPDSTVAIGTVLPGPPAAPVTFTASDTSCSVVVLEWSASVDADYYLVYRDGARIDSLAAAVLGYQDSPGGSGSFTYGIAAGNECGVSDSTEAKGVVLPGAPGAITGFTAGDTACVSVTMNWDTAVDADTVFLQRGGAEIAQFLLGETTFNEVVPPGVYEYSIFAANECGRSITVIDSVEVFPLPVPPTALAASIDSCGLVHVTWTGAAGDAGYAVYREDAFLANVTDSFYGDTAAPIGASTYWIATLNACGASDSVSVVGTRPPDAPSAPALAAATDDSCTAVFVSWSASADADSYFVYRDGAVIARTVLLAFADTPPPGTYDYAVAAGNSCGVSDSTVDSGTLLPPPPIAPTLASASDSLCDRVEITWGDVANEAGYVVYRNSVVLDTVPANTVLFTDTGIAPGASSNYQVGAFNACSAGPAVSGSLAGSRLPAAPAAVNDLVASDDSCGVVVLAWTDVADEDGYVIERDGAPIDTIAAGATGYRDSPASIDVALSYRVGVFNTCSGGVIFGNADFGTALPGAPGLPANVLATDDSCGAVYITWTPGADIDSQFVLRNGAILERLGPADASYQDLTAVPAVTYAYAIRSRNDCGATDSGADNGTRPPDAPVSPAGLAATLDSCAYVLLAWGDVADEDGYTVYRDSTPLLTLPPNVVVWRDSSALPGATYTYQVSAFNGCSIAPALSNTAQGSRPPVPVAVTGLFATDDDCDFVQLTWVDGTDESGYRVERDGGVLVDLPPDVTSFTDSSIPAGTTAAYRVGALAQCIPDAAYSSEANGTRLAAVPIVPASVVATDDSCAAVRVTWNASPGADGYEVLRDGLFAGLVSDGSLFFRDVTPPPGASFYEVRALNACGTSAAAGDSGAAAEPPAIPVIDSASTDRCDGIMITWIDVANEDGYIVYRNLIGIDTLPADVTSYLDTLADGALPTLYRVGAFAPCFPAPTPSNPAQGVRLPTPPVPVTGLVATTDRCDGIALTWDDTEGEEFYIVARNGFAIANLPAGSVSHLDTTALAGSTNDYRVGGANFCSGGLPVYGDSVQGSRPFAAPEAVDSLTASQDSCGVIRLEWIAPVESDTVSIVRDFVDEIARIPAAAGFYRDTSSVTGSPLYSLTALNSCGASKPVLIQGARKPDTPPPPATVSASTDSCDGVFLAWSDVENEFGYIILRGGVLVDTVLADVTSYVDTTAAPGVDHSYEIGPFNDCTITPLFSAAVTGAILPPPVPVTTLTASTDNCAGIQLTWTGVAFASGYSVYRAGVFLDSVAPGVTAYLDTAVAYGSTHRYQIGSLNRCSFGPVFGDTLSGTRPFDQPDPPAGVSATDDLCQVVNVVWNESPNATSYVIERNGNQIGEVFDSPYFFTDTSVQPGSYTYAVKARNLCGTSTGSVDTGTRRAGPGEPSNLTATQDLCEGVRLTWSAAANVSSYTIRRGGVTIATNLPASATTYFDDGATGGVSSIYTVEALNVCGSRISDPGVVGRRLAGAPSGPSNVSATDGGCSEIAITWSYSGSTTSLVGFQISFRDLNTGGVYDSITTLPVSSNSFVHTPPPGNYEYWVSARNQCGSSPQTDGSQDEGAILGIPPAPAWDAASDSSSCTGESFTLRWNALPNVLEYRVSQGGFVVSTVDTSFAFVRSQTGDYNFTVTAFTACGPGSASTLFPVTVLASPSPPTNVSASQDSCGFIDLVWQNGTDSRVWIASAGDTAFLGAGVQSWRDDHPDGGPRSYHVGGYNACGTLGSTTLLTGFAFPDFLPAPDSVHATDGLCDSVIVTWTYEAPLEPVQDFRVIRYDGASATTIAFLSSDDVYRVVDTPPDAASRRYGVQAENRCALSIATEDFGRANRTPGIPIWTAEVGDACQSASFSLRWQAVSGAGSYEVFRDGSLIATVLQPSLRLSVFETGEFEFRVRAVSDCGPGPLGESQLVRVVDLPAVPLDVRIDSSYCDSVHVTWSPQLDSIRVTRSDRVDPVYVGAGNGFATDFPVKGVTYRVRSFNGCGESEEVTVTLGRPLIRPPAPVAVTASNTLCDSVVITWSMPQSQIVLSGFEISRTRNDSTTIVANSLAPSLRRFVDRGGVGLYEYRIVATNECGVSLDVETARDFGSFRPAFLATNFSSESDSVGCRGSNIELVWEPDPDALFYNVWETGDEIPVAVVAGSNSSASLLVTSIGDRSYELQSVGVCGDGLRSAPWLVRVGETPVRLSGLRASDDLCGAVRLDWNRSASVMEEVRVYRSGEWIASASPTDTTFMDESVALGETYEYFVVGASRCGTAGASPVAEGSALRGLTSPVLSGPPSGATNLPIPVTMSWTPVPAAIGYYLEVQDPDVSEIVLDSLLPASPSVTIGGLSLGERYLWRVATVDDCGPGIPSAWRNFQTIQSAPAVLASDPASFATGVALDANVRVVFSLPIDPASLSGAQLFRGDTEVPVSRRLETEGSVLVVDPVDSLRFNTTYSLLVGGLRDIFGQGLGGTAPITFTTAPAPRPVGDVDIDFQRTPADVARAADIVLGRVNPAEYDVGEIDLNRDGRFGVGDVVLLGKLIVKEGVVLLPDFSKSAPHAIRFASEPSDGRADADGYALRLTLEGDASRSTFLSLAWPEDAGRVTAIERLQNVNVVQSAGEGQNTNAEGGLVFFSQSAGTLRVLWNEDAGADTYRIFASGGGAPEALTVRELLVTLGDGAVARAKSAGESIAVTGPRLLHVSGPDASPNPFNPVTTLRYHVPGVSDVLLVIYDLSGRAVRTLEAGRRAAGWHAPVWDGKSDNGEAVASGLYFARLEARGDGHDDTRTSRIVLIR
ncbi:MAG: hypothetical protein HKN20_06040 [Gemmatimonadetes bacterium]|nr:hypothetical protein [Gemmatimonadota bacterium]